MATFDEFYSSLDSDPSIRGKQFEKFVKCRATGAAKSISLILQALNIFEFNTSNESSFHSKSTISPQKSKLVLQRERGKLQQNQNTSNINANLKAFKAFEIKN